MVEQQIRTWEVLDQDVLDLLYLVPREEFVPPQHRSLAFSDAHLPLGEDEHMWEPKMEARVLQELTVRKSTDRVLEVGTGSGYLTALLAHRAAHVYSVEVKPALAEFGRRNLERHGAENITLELGDAARGWPRHAPYEVIVLTGSSPLLPRAFLEQLAVGGRLAAVTGGAPELEPDRDVVVICHHGARSMQAGMFLEKQGFSRVHNLVGGIDAWARTVDPAVPLY